MEIKSKGDLFRFVGQEFSCSICNASFIFEEADIPNENTDTVLGNEVFYINKYGNPRLKSEHIPNISVCLDETQPYKFSIYLRCKICGEIIRVDLKKTEEELISSLNDLVSKYAECKNERDSFEYEIGNLKRELIFYKRGAALDTNTTKNKPFVSKLKTWMK